MDTGTGIGHAASEMMKELQKAQQDLQKLDKQHGTGGTNFKETMDAHGVNHANKAGDAHHVQGTHSAKNVLAQAKINANLPSVKVNAVANAERSKWADMLNDMIGGQDKMNGIMKMALSGRQFSPPELLAMQAGVYRFSQELELTSKVIEKATSGIKQTMNTQV
ncbi:MAG: hypothetical protein ACAI38_10480 [Myxococcota bacterium]